MYIYSINLCKFLFLQECCEAALSNVGTVHGAMQFEGTVRWDGKMVLCA